MVQRAAHKTIRMVHRRHYCLQLAKMVGVLPILVLVSYLSSSKAESSGPLEDPSVGHLDTYVSKEGHNRPECIGGGADDPCESLVYVAHFLNKNGSLFDSFSVVIQGPDLPITSNISIANISNLVLSGSPTDLKCICQECSLSFRDSRNLTLQNLSFNECGDSRTHSAAVVFYDCHNVVVVNSSFSDSVKSGLYMRDTSGNVEIRGCVFQGNGVCSTCSGSSGLALRFTSSSNSDVQDMHSTSTYTIEHCQFVNNRDMGALSYSGNSSGGGVDLQFIGNSTGNTVSFKDVCIEDNSATWGGGMGIEFCENAHGNSVYLRQVTFDKNNASKAGGGLDVGYINGASDPPITNVVYAEDCNFTDNHARYGAGTAMYASHTDCVEESDHNDSTLVFKSCTWNGNVGSFGSTVDISPSAYDTLGSMYFPHPKFIDCSFTASEQFETRRNWTFLLNVGSFTVNAFEVLFEGTVHFQKHTVTPLHVTDGRVTFLPGTQAYFKNNHGSQGGALALFGSSLLQVFPNTTLSFINNSASSAGGAIFQSTQNHHDFFSSRTCFIQNGSHAHYRPDSDAQPVLYFRGNRVDLNQTGQAIYATTFLPCYFQEYTFAPFTTYSVMDALRRIVNLDFGDQRAENMALATSGWLFEFPNTTLSVIPGKSINIPLTMKDELNNDTPSVYRVVENNMCPADRHYMISRITLTSPYKQVCSLSLVSLSFRESLFKVNISIQKCPPGFYMDTKTNTCSCSAYSKDEAYFGINSCHDQQSNAYLSNTYWAGYDRDESLLTAHCPSSFCIREVDKEVHGIKLPKTSSSADLQKAVCHPHRRGWLCGKCECGHTTYFHSPTYQCRREHLCSLGALFYFVSEVFPIVVMFSVIALFDIRFTTGTASGLVFFAQIVDTVTLEMKWNSRVPQAFEDISNVYRVVYGLFNFDFFNLEPASFCLWKNATVLDVVAFKYLSVLFAFVLLSCIVLFLKFCTCHFLQSKKGVLAVGKHRSVIHSMSAVLVMCYAQCTNISFQILAKATLRGAGSEPKHTVTLFGGISYFSPGHLAYALAACFCLSTIVAIPPFLLLVYPNYLTFLSLFKFNEPRPIQRFFIKLKPFFDCFQGCYRDKLRFFSALYFLGRVAILAINAFVTSTSQSILTMIIILLLLLTLYSVCQPFHCSADNTNNVLILVNLTLIGLFTTLAYSQDGYEEQKNVVLFSLAVRLVLLHLPIVCTVAYVVKKIVSSMRRGRETETNEMEENITTNESTHQVIDHTYLPYQEVAVDTSQPSADAEISYSYTDREELLAYI